ncbi:hypothetical protein KSB_69040 [Ktedonobacter robiniae]|uniref:Uncharacterized protein n=1 Tax=Ktedonobacter robiniae TaxID=2778365 RepID=A0ABQ3UZW3_9CHLR|nr:hypothetical protein [Ktedonobacter robiniae]GHO58429.1 hypothetical protein KSB_69040 [Ktedonobacter robiniae]
MGAGDYYLLRREVERPQKAQCNENLHHDARYTLCQDIVQLTRQALALGDTREVLA